MSSYKLKTGSVVIKSNGQLIGYLSLLVVNYTSLLCVCKLVYLNYKN